MEKTTDEMDLDEWDLLSDDGFLDIHSHEDVGKGLLVSTKLDFNPKGVFVMDYFAYQSPHSCPIVDISKTSSVSNVLPKPIYLDPKILDEEIVKEVIKVAPVYNSEKIKMIENPKVGGDQDMISLQVFFGEPKGNKFVDIKMDSPKSGCRGVKIQEEKEAMDSKIVKEDLVQEKNCLDSSVKEEIKWEESRSGGLNIWRWRLTGIGALCSIGMAAASICIFIIGSQQRQKHHQQNQKLQFQIYTDDKRFKQVVHQATKLNQAISSVRGGAFNRAHFTFGGNYAYDGL